MAAPGNQGTSPIGELMKRLGEMTERIGSINQSVHQLFLAFRQLNELSRRFSMTMMLAVGAPRFVRGDLYHWLRGPKDEAGKGGDGSSAPTPKTAEERMAEILKEHEYRQQLKAADHEADRKYFDELEGYKERKEAAKWERIKGRNSLDEYSAAARAHDATTPPSRNPAGAKVDPEFLAEHEFARSYAVNQLGVAPDQVPPADPNNPHTRDWVNQVQKLAGPNAGAGAPPERVAPTYTGSATTPSAAGKKGFGGVVLGELQQSAKELAHTFLGLSSVMQELVKAASPDTYETFTKSLELLAAAVGSDLIPLFLMLSQAAQDLAGWWGKLDPNVKGVAMSMAKWVLVVSAAGALGAALVTATAAMGVFGLGLVALGTAAQLLQRLFPDQKSPERMSVAELEKTGEYAWVKKRHEEMLAKGDFETDPLTHKSALQRAAESVRDENLASAQHLHGLSADYMSKLGMPGEKPPPWSMASAWDDVRKLANPMLKRASEFEDTAGMRETNAKLIDEWIKKSFGPDERKGAGVSRLLMAFSTIRGNSQYMPVEQAYKRTQLSALGDDPLTAEIKKMELQYLEKFLAAFEKNGNRLESIADYVKFMVGL